MRVSGLTIINASLQLKNRDHNTKEKRALAVSLRGAIWCSCAYGLFAEHTLILSVHDVLMRNRASRGGGILWREWSKNWNALKRRDFRFSQSPAAVSLSQVSPG